MRCTVCNHPLSDDINLAILSGDYTLDELSQKFGPSRSALFRHGRHLKQKMARCRKRVDNHLKQVSYLKLSALLDHVQKGVESAAAEGHVDRVFKGSHVGSRLIYQINNLDLPLELDTAYLLLHTPGPVSLDSILPQGPQTIAALHQYLVDQTFAPCPPPDEDDADAPSAEPPADHPALANDLPPLPAAPAAKHQRRQAARQARRQLRQDLRRQKYTLNGKIPVENLSFSRPAAPNRNVGRESEAHPAAQPPATPLETRNPELDTTFPDPWPLTPDPCPDAANVGRESEAHPAAPDNLYLPPAQALAPEASPPETVPENKRDKSATTPRQQRRQLRKMLQHQRHILKAKKLLKNFISGRPNPATLEPSAVPETRNPEPETFNDSDASFPDPWPLTPDPCPDAANVGRESEAHPAVLEPPIPETTFPEPGNQKQETGPPPNHLPNRRRYDNYPSRSIFMDIKNVLKYM